ncbi:unnamed protein product [Brugia timori]|uniref:Ovule protein n=1 Tax=Brugia timori TaxID=42155 RepID=A0A0R3Q4N3_9BILA|nr:unnamed protein product [Brugia timori]
MDNWEAKYRDRLNQPYPSSSSVHPHLSPKVSVTSFIDETTSGTCTSSKVQN